MVDGDSYGENNFVTILVNNDADLTNLAPLFNISSGATLHVEGGSTVEVSGESFHDFSGDRYNTVWHRRIRRTQDSTG